MVKKVILTADSTCDLGDVLKERYDVHYQPLHIHLGGKEYLDGIDMTPDIIYDTYNTDRILPKTSAPNPKDYIDFFKQWTDKGYEVVHFSLGSGLSSSYQNSVLAAQELGNVYPIDSCNLSTGIGLLVIEAAERIAKGMKAEDIYEEVKELRGKVQASFVIDNLTYLYEGGRCSALANLSANLLNIKPCIEVDNTSGNMVVGKKYRGSLPKVLKKYTKEKLNSNPNLKTDRIFITHSGTDAKNIDIVKQTIEEHYDFKEILVTRAGCTITSHCGPNTLGILFMNE